VSWKIVSAARALLLFAGGNCDRSTADTQAFPVLARAVACSVQKHVTSSRRFLPYSSAAIDCTLTMSKPISFGFGKQKTSAPAKAISLPARKPAPVKPKAKFGHESDNEDEGEPQLESVTGFTSSGAILSQPVQEKEVFVIKNSGNGDWRTRGRGKNLLPAEVQAQQNGQAATVVEKSEVSKASGLQLAAPGEETTQTGQDTQPEIVATSEGTKQLSEDEQALRALLGTDGDKPTSSTVIAALSNAPLQYRDESEDFRSDVAARPEMSSLEEYAAMPVEEFGMAMLRGMGQKRRANGEVISFNKTEDNPKKVRKQEGFLGIGAKAVPGSGVELGAWGKADMRKNNRGEGFFTPLMRENKATGERITEEELQKRMKEQKGKKEEDDWRDRRDRNLDKSGRHRGGNEKPTGDRKAITNGEDVSPDRKTDSSRHSSSARDDRDYDRSRSRRDKDDRDYESSRSRKDRSRSRDRRHRDKNQYRNADERYDSGSARKSSHKDRDRDRDYERDRDRDRRHRDR